MIRSETPSRLESRSSSSVRFKKSCREAIANVRAGLGGHDLLLFDLLCLAGHIGDRMPYDDVNLALVSGARDPRKRLLRSLPANCRDGTAASSRHWARAGDRLVRLLARELPARAAETTYVKLCALLGNAPITLAPDCVVPVHPVLRVAWKTVVTLFARIYPSTAKSLGRLEWLNSRHMTTLRREAARGMQIGRPASGRERPGLAGRCLAVDPRLLARVGAALGKEVVPGYEARYVFYGKAGDHFWPHPDDPEYPVNVLVCLDRKRPRGSTTASAFLAYRPDFSVERYDLAPGCALAIESRGLVHAREPLREGERVTLLSIALNYAPASAGAQDELRRNDGRKSR